MSSLFSGSLCLVITGASRGFGRAVSIKFAEEIKNSSCNADIYLLARSKDGLEETAKLIQQTSQNIQAHVVQFDLSDIAGLSASFTNLTDAIPMTKYNNAVLINNGGTMGALDHLINVDNIEDTNKCLSTNFLSYQFITSKFMQHFRNTQTQLHLVNISSLAALQPFEAWGLYCCMKAARNMLMAAIAMENANVKTLNYAPGPMETKLFKEASERTVDSGTKTWMKESVEKNSLVDPFQSAAKLVTILKECNYKSGTHIDYFDE